ncbi:MAG TPA: methyltransferase domain-containing protein [Gemmatimonadaceae bacterium]|nr:methyltransferase domain-containing protein [Gemmatimonadaceae bacterium]
MSDRETWDARHRAALGTPLGAPSAWVMSRALSLSAHDTIVDLAAGRGRHAVPLARAGHRVVAIDIVAAALADARAAAPMDAIAADASRLPLRSGSIDAIVCVNFLDRTLFPSLASLLRPGGAAIVETFTVAQRALGRGPSSDAFLLQSDELPGLLAPLVILENREGLVRDAAGERYVAQVMAMKEAVSRR